MKKEKLAINMVLRGFDRQIIIDETGVDPGYHNSAFKARLKGIDRRQWKIDYILDNNTQEDLMTIIELYKKGYSRDELLDKMGVHDSHLSLNKIFSTAGLADQFKEVDKAVRNLNMTKGTQEKYGVDNIFKLSEFQEKAADSRQRLYGGRYTLSAGSVFEQSARIKINNTKKQNNVPKKEKIKGPYAKPEGGFDKDKYWTPKRRKDWGEHMRDVEAKTRDKRLITMQEKYGVDWYPESEEFKAKMSDYWKDPEYAKNVVDRTIQTSIQRYGVSHWYKTDEGRKIASQRMSDPHYQMRINTAKRKNGTFSTSDVEERLYEMLKAEFDEVYREYQDPRYPFLVDFYIPQRDLFIELNGHWTHGGHWFNEDCQLDQNIVEGWKEKSTKFYNHAVKVWAVKDVEKRKVAANNSLNYVVFWDGNNLLDAELWFGMGCPDGHDWDNMYSWLPKRNLYCDIDYSKMGTSNKVATKAAKAANGAVFYETEIQMWNDNPMRYKWGNIQGYLYANRYKYLGKLPDELTNAEILRAFKISGVYKGFSSFDNQVMVKLINDYKVSQVYDPCAGWGERLYTAGAMGVGYEGVDINPKLITGYNEIIDYYGFDNLVVHRGDSANFVPGKADMVFTCPPYFNTEIYSELGAENLDFDEFLDWWGKVVKSSKLSGARVFAFQVNQKYLEPMRKIVELHGWILCDRIDLDKKISHLTPTRSERESVLVFNIKD